VSEIYKMRVHIEEHIKAKGLDFQEVRGQIGLRAGKLLAFITPTTADEPAAIVKLKKAAKDVLNLNL
jgi:hypothetical protein